MHNSEAQAEKRITVEVPATSANLGPGFDCLGLALDLHNVVSVEVGDEVRIDVAGEGADRLSRNSKNLVYRAMSALYETIGSEPPAVHLSLHNRVPLARGLGSSSAAVVGGLFAANVLAGNPLSTSHLLQLAHKLEGHPDNVAAALYGGLTVAVADGDEVICMKGIVPAGLKAALFIPDFAMSTREARKVLPRHVSLSDAVHNIGRTAALVTALATNQLEYLSFATGDRLHQPYRQQIYPQMAGLFAAAMEAGASGVFLSGAGSTICALCSRNEQSVIDAMSTAAARLGVSGRSLICNVSEGGVRVLG